MCGNLFEIYTIHFRFECLHLSHPSMQMQGKDVWIRDRDEFLFCMQSLHTYCRVSCHLIDLLLRHIVKYLGCARVRGGRLAAGLLAEGRPCLPCLPCLPWEEWQTVLANEALSHSLTEHGSQLQECVCSMGFHHCFGDLFLTLCLRAAVISPKCGLLTQTLLIIGCE